MTKGKGADREVTIFGGKRGEKRSIRKKGVAHYWGGAARHRPSRSQKGETEAQKKKVASR